MRKADPKSEAVPLLRRALEIRRRHYGSADERTSDAVYKLAGLLHMTGDHAGARPLFQEWIDLALRGPARVAPDRAERLRSMAYHALFSGRTEDAERLAREALAMERAMYGDDHRRVAFALATLGWMLKESGRTEEADSMLRRPIALMRATYPHGHLELASALRDYGYLLTLEQRWPEAETTWREAAELYRRFGRESSLAFVNATAHVGYAVSRLGRNDEAVPMLREAIQRQQDSTWRDSPVLARTRLFLALALVEREEMEEAEQLLLQARGKFGEPADRPRSYERLTLETLADLYERQGNRSEAARYRAMLGGRD
jgi:serine/threonine-protein kinase